MIELLNNIAQIWWAWMWPMLWQVSLLIALIGGVDLLIRKRVWPQVRYALWLLVLVKLILPPTFSLSTSVVAPLRPLLQQLVKGRAAVSDVADISPPVVYLVETNLLANPLVGQPAALNDLGYAEMGGTTDSAVQSEPTESGSQFGAQIEFSPQAYAMAGWLLGVTLFSVWLAIRFRQLRHGHCRDADMANFPPWFAGTLADTASKLKLRRLPAIVRSRRVACPAVFGVFRPVLLVPAAEMKRFSRQKTEHILLHELAHIKRGDLKIHTLCALLQIVYWFNPLLWLVQRRLQHLRELCCDATVARVLQDRTPDYRQTIMETANWLLAKPRIPGLGLVGLVENRNRLLVRLRWLEKKPWKHRSLRIATCFVVVTLMFACVLPMAEARQAVPDESQENTGVEVGVEPELLDAADATKNDSEPLAMPSGSAEVPPKASILFDCKLYYVPANVGVVEANQQAIGQKNPFVVLEGSEHADRLKALSQEHPHVHLVASPQILAKSGRETLIQMMDEAGSSRELKLVGLAKYGGQVISITLDFEHEGRMSVRSQLSTRNEEPLTLGWRVTDNTEEVLVITPHLVSAEGEKAAPVPIKREDSQTAAGYINTGDFDRQAKQLREMLEGGISTILTGLRDDKGRLVTVIYFKAAEDSPLVLHLAEQNGGWLIDYFYVGSGDIENRDPIPSRKKLPRSQYVRLVRDETDQKKPGGQMDENPLGAVDRQIQHLRTILEGQNTGLKIVCGAGDAIKVITELAGGPQREAGYIVYHLIQENGKYRIECMESADDVKLQPEPRPGVSDVGVPEPTTRPPDILAFDDFDGKLSLDWEILNPDETHYSLAKKPGALTITTQYGALRSSRTDYKNLFLIDNPAQGGDFQVTICLSSFKPKAPRNQAGIICYDDDDNYIKWVHEIYQTPAFTIGAEAHGQFEPTYFRADPGRDKVWLRVTKRANQYAFSTSVDGETFIVHAQQQWGDGSPKRLGLVAKNGVLDQAPDLDAAFEFFEVAAVPSQALQAAAKQEPEVARPARHPIPEANLQIPEQLKPCAERLRTIHGALKEYEKDKGSMPDWLSDLVPDYLSTETLIWPEDGPKSTPLAADRHLPCSFGYQYSSSRPLPEGKMSYREFKDRERKVWGDVVPLVRYYIGKQCLNVSFDGRIYMSGTAWEREIQPQAGAPEVLILREISVPASPGPEPVRKVSESVAEQPKVLAFDDFDGKLSLDWEILQPDPSHYSLTKKPGALVVTTQPGSFSKSHQADYKNLFLIDCPKTKGRDLQLTTCVSSFTPQEHWNQAGLIFWKDQDNYIKCTYQTWYGRRVAAVVTETDGTLTNAIHQPTDGKFDRIWLRFTKRTNVYEIATSVDGQSFETHGAARWGEGSIAKVGLIALNGSHSPAPELDAEFEFFEAKAVPARSPETIPLRGTTLPRIRTSAGSPAQIQPGVTSQKAVIVRSGRPETQLPRLATKSRAPKRVASNLPDGTGGHALQFDGIDDCVMIPPDRSLDIRGSLTVSAWVKHAGDRRGVIIWRGDGAVACDPYALEASGQRMYFRMDASKRCYVASRTILDDQWHFWTAVCDKEAGKLCLYKDGSLESSTDIDVTLPYDTSRMWNMFGAVVLGQHTSEHFGGTIDEVRIWNVTRHQDQIKEYMNRSLAGTEPGLVGYWKFDEDDAEIIANRTVYLNNGITGQLPWDI